MRHKNEGTPGLIQKQSKKWAGKYEHIDEKAEGEVNGWRVR